MALIKSSLPTPSSQALRYENIASEETLHGVGALPGTDLSHAVPKALTPASPLAAPLTDKAQVTSATATAVASAPAAGSTSAGDTAPAAIAAAKNIGADVNKASSSLPANNIQTATVVPDNNSTTATSNSGSSTSRSSITEILGLNGRDGTNGNDGRDGRDGRDPTDPNPTNDGPLVTVTLGGHGATGTLLDLEVVNNLIPGVTDHPLIDVTLGQAPTAQTPGGVLDVNLLQNNDHNSPPLTLTLGGEGNATGSLADLNLLTEPLPSVLPGVLPAELTAPVTGIVDSLIAQPLVDLTLGQAPTNTTAASVADINLLQHGTEDGPLATVTLGGEGNATGSLIDANLPTDQLTEALPGVLPQELTTVVGSLTEHALVDLTLGQAAATDTPALLADVNLLQNGLHPGQGPALELNLGGHNTDGTDGGLADVGLLDNALLPLDSIATVGLGGAQPLEVTVLGQPVSQVIEPALDQLVSGIADHNLTPLGEWTTEPVAPEVVHNVVPVTESVLDSLGAALDSVGGGTGGHLPSNPIATVENTVQGLTAPVADNPVHTTLTTITNTVASLPVVPAIPSLPALGHGFHF